MFKQVILLFLLLTPAFLTAEDLKSLLDSLRKQYASSNSGIQIVNLSEQSLVYSYNAQEALKPASVLKLLITAYVLENFGSDYRFVTELYQTSDNKLVIKGSGDPNFRTEDLWILLRQLKKQGITNLNGLHLDDSAFVEKSTRSGQRAYQTGASALAFNFNSLLFNVCGTSRGKPARISWDPWEYWIQLSGNIITSGSKNFDIYETSSGSLQQFKAKGSTTSGCTGFYRSISDPRRYLASTARAFLNYLGIKVTGETTFGRYTGSKTLLAEHQSKALSDIVADLNHFSNNFIAEQLLFAIGKEGSNYSRETGLKNLSRYVSKMGYGSSEFSLHDASGLSHSNKISARILLDIMEKAYMNPAIKSEYLKSLAISGQTGTLKRRKYPLGLTLRGKTGTINGVDTIAGFLTSKSRQAYAFVILQNSVSSGQKSQGFEDRLIELLYSK